MIHVCVLGLLVVLLGACSSNVKQPIYLSNPQSVDQLIEVRELNSTFDDLDASINAEEGTQFAQELKVAFNSQQIKQDFREYLLINVPQTNVQAWVEYYSSDFQRKIARLENENSQANLNPDFESQLLQIKKNKKLTAKLDKVIGLINLDRKLYSIIHDGVFKPLIYAGALSNNPGAVLEESVLDEIVKAQVDKYLPEIIKQTKQVHYYIYAQLSDNELNQLIAYYEAPISDYYENTLVSALNYSLSEASKRFIQAVSVKHQSQIQGARFNKESCLKVQRAHVCEILALSSIGERESLFVGGSVIGKSEAYRIMAPSDDWQKIHISGQYLDDLIMSRKDGDAILTVVYTDRSELAAKEYADEILGAIATAIKTEPYLVKLNLHPSIEQSELYEICYNYFGVDVCKIAGEGLLDGHVVKIHSFFVSNDGQIQEIMNLLTSIEKLKPMQ